MLRYRFSEFILSPRRRLLVRNGREQPLIPRYFDLLVFLIERRGEAVHRRDIFDRVWGDVIVSDSALSQAVRTIRRVLGDESREPRFVPPSRVMATASSSPRSSKKTTRASGRSSRWRLPFRQTFRTPRPNPP